MKLLEVKHLQTHFISEDKTVKAVDDISFDLNKGETLGIVGESGSGKSISSLSIMRLLPSQKASIVGGEINFFQDGKYLDLVQASEEEMQSIRGNKISMIFQEPMNSLNPVMHCGDQVAEIISIHNKLQKTEIKNKVLDLFEKVDLPDPERMFKAYPHQLSGGQIQRIMIAMAIANEPDIIIADEPTTALDVTVQKKILALLVDMKNKYDASVIFISHDLAVVAEVADKVAVMYKGKIVEYGPIKEIFKNPKHPYTQSLLACRPPLNFKMDKLPTVADFMPSEPGIEASGFDFEAHRLSEQALQKRIQDIEQKSSILKVEGLSKRYPKPKPFFWNKTQYTEAVKDVSFDVRKSEILGLVGESGCGKSTIAKSLIQLIDIDSGAISFEGKSIFSNSGIELKQLRKDLQIVFQDPYSSLNPRMTIGEAILEPMMVHNIHSNKKNRKEKVVELLELVGMSPDHYNRYPHQFSGGQRQRICIARTLSLEPKFIVCDECVSALDVSVQAQVINLLLELREQFDLSYIFISHDLSVVKFISDRIMVMNQGEIVEEGNPDEIYSNPQNPYTAKLIDAIPKGLG